MHTHRRQPCVTPLFDTISIYLDTEISTLYCKMAAKKFNHEVEKVMKEVKAQMDLFDDKWRQLRALTAEFTVLQTMSPEAAGGGMKAKKKVGNRPQCLESMDQRYVQDSISKFKNELEVAHKKLYKFRNEMDRLAASPDLKNSGRTVQMFLDVKKDIESRSKKGKTFYLRGVSSDITDVNDFCSANGAISWIEKFSNELKSQIDTMNAKIEDGENSEEKDVIIGILDVHYLHYNRLEKLMRALQNRVISQKGYKYENSEEGIVAQALLEAAALAEEREEEDSESDQADLLEEIKELLEPYLYDNEDWTYIVCEEIYDRLPIDFDEESVEAEEPESESYVEEKPIEKKETEKINSPPEKKPIPSKILVSSAPVTSPVAKTTTTTTTTTAAPQTASITASITASSTASPTTTTAPPPAAASNSIWTGAPKTSGSKSESIAVESKNSKEMGSSVQPPDPKVTPIQYQPPIPVPAPNPNDSVGAPFAGPRSPSSSNDISTIESDDSGSHKWNLLSPHLNNCLDRGNWKQWLEELFYETPGVSRPPNVGPDNTDKQPIHLNNQLIYPEYDHQRGQVRGAVPKLDKSEMPYVHQLLKISQSVAANSPVDSSHYNDDRCPLYSDVVATSSWQPPLSYQAAYRWQQLGLCTLESTELHRRPRLLEAMNSGKIQHTDSICTSYLKLDRGDMIQTIAAVKEGWLYGRNRISGQMGWFPAVLTTMVPTKYRDIYLKYATMRFRQKARGVGAFPNYVLSSIIPETDQNFSL